MNDVIAHALDEIRSCEQQICHMTNERQTHIVLSTAHDDQIELHAVIVGRNQFANHQICATKVILYHKSTI